MYQFLSGKVKVYLADITSLPVDAIVNAANSTLMGGGGVDGAIHRAGGKSILEECKKIREEQYPDGLPTGQAVVTSAGNMKTKHVIHTVGPIYRERSQQEAEFLLASAYSNSLFLAKKEGCKSIAFPAISTGIYGYPPSAAAMTASSVLRRILKGFEMEVHLVFFDESQMQIFLDNQKFDRKFSMVQSFLEKFSSLLSRYN